MEYATFNAWHVFGANGYCICGDRADDPKEAVELALEQTGLTLQTLIEEGYTVCLTREDEYTWIEILDEVPVSRVVEFYGMKEVAMTNA